ncbi:efflux transporter outer membrane subunit [Paracoccus sp. IB05]|uniref:efflux transporter outer membrane subunit n=1 Tax=Paracoccus sp. IB05 TaxID=2779367 RepID=UPI0018E8FE74|nr:efflux transporter outer membrane subunit [Paracoccus sp. IB05]MBJ2153151.1 efflux transporter outer membrane subunit [Paracoccus sp. IB05]
MTKPLASLLVSALALSACAVPVEYKRPDLPGTPGWPGAEASRHAGQDWWRAFGDPGIDALVQTALAANSDILTASLRAQRAMIQAGEARAALWPQLSGSVGANRSGGTESYSTSLGASYELDLRGRLLAQNNRAALEARASIADLETARVTVTANAIEAWWRLADANARIAEAETNLATLRETAALVDRQVSSGAASDLERAQMDQSLAEARAQIPDLIQARDVLRNSLVQILAGREFSEPTALRVRAALSIPAGLPADLLSNRPDLRAAELRLRASLRDVDAARAALYPQITLTGSLGTSSTDLGRILRDPASTLGVGVTLPFLNPGAGRRALLVSQLQYEEAVVAFRQSLLAAFGDTDLALKSRERIAERQGQLARALAAAREAERLTGLRYGAGAIPLRDLLQAQERRRAAQSALNTADLDRRLADLQLLRSLGASPEVSG